MRDPCSTANMGFKPLLLLVLSVSKDIRFSLGWNQYGIYHSWWDGIYRETCIEYTCTYILLHTYTYITLHYITLHYIMWAYLHAPACVQVRTHARARARVNRRVCLCSCFSSVHMWNARALALRTPRLVRHHIWTHLFWIKPKYNLIWLLWTSIGFWNLMGPDPTMFQGCHQRDA